jgi:hypothetical protein
MRFEDTNTKPIAEIRDNIPKNLRHSSLYMIPILRYCTKINPTAEEFHLNGTDFNENNHILSIEFRAL